MTGNVETEYTGRPVKQLRACAGLLSGAGRARGNDDMSNGYPRIGAIPFIASDKQEEPGLNAKVGELLVGADAAG